MKPTKTLLAAFALAGACGSVSAFDQAAIDPGIRWGSEGVRGGFFVVPERPVAYSFADICNLTIEPGPSLRTVAAGPLAAPDLSSIWAKAEKQKPAGADAGANARAAAKPPPTAGVPQPPAAVPQPADWMQLCGFAIIALIAKRRRDWSALRGLALRDPVPLRPRNTDRESWSVRTRAGRYSDAIAGRNLQIEPMP